MTAPTAETFDGISFDTTRELLEFLKHEYYAHQSTIRILNESLRAAEAAQHERDCAAVCPLCHAGIELVSSHIHVMPSASEDEQSFQCKAAAIRAQGEKVKT